MTIAAPPDPRPPDSELSGEGLRYDEVEVTFWDDPLIAGARLVDAGLSETFVLYERGGRWSLGLGALVEIVVDRHEVVRRGTWGEPLRVPWSASPLPAVAKLLDGLPLSGWRAYGWAAFELAYACAARHDLLADDRLLHLVVPHTDVRLEYGRAVVRSTDPMTLRRVVHLLTTPVTPRSDRPYPAPPERTGGDDYCQSVASAVEEIRAGQLQKVILSRVVPVAHPVDLVGTYVVGRRENTPSRSFLLAAGGVRACGFSPEIVVEVDAGGRVTTQPLAGTRARAGVPDEDGRLRSELLHDTKEIFEHSISVKVAYDELASLCEPGSVAVDAFMTVKERGSVQHLASSVSGQLAPGVSRWRAFAELFPAVTVSGVPKLAAYDAISRHEAEARGLYGGAVMVVDQAGALDAALVLRSVFQQGSRTWLRAGAGIVGQSDPARELEETCEKLRSVSRHLVARPPS